MDRRVIVDTREQRPYVFEGSVRKALPAGDYSLEGLETQFAIERKSLDDWVSTVIHDANRFAAELAKLREYQIAVIVIEGGLSDILSGNYKSKATPHSLLGITLKLMLENHGRVQIVFCDDRPHAYALVSEMLELAAKRFA